MKAHNNIRQLEWISDKKFIGEAKTDLKLAVDLILSDPPNYGMSRWSSLQFVEKLLKSYMVEANITFDKIHNIKKLNTRAKSDGHLQGLPDDVIDKIECNADTRYDMASSSLHDAIESHSASIDACLHLANPIRIRQSLINI